MTIESLMSKNPRTCRSTDTLEQAAQIMWDCDCGVVPVVDDEGRAIGMITDRDVCMAALTQRRPLGEIGVSTAASKGIFVVRPSDSPSVAEQLMREKKVRRLAVVEDGGRLVGMLSLNDLARHTGQRRDDLGVDEIARTLQAISVPARRTATNGSH